MNRATPTQQESAFVEVRALVKHFGATRVIDDLSFSVARGECLTLLGPSGCGKTTTLRCIAGFETPDSGYIEIDGRRVCDPEHGVNVTPERRHFGMVFQSYAVWPHMSVEQNVAYGLQGHGLAKSEIAARVTDVLRLVGLRGRESDSVTRLSGGQQQRVALARALAYRPKVLLFDEPLSNLDAKLRGRMRQELRRLHQETGITSVYVTHDQEEAMVVADRILVMNEGRMEQIGRPSEVYDQPATRFVADFVGDSNIVAGHLLSVRDGVATVELKATGKTTLRCTLRRGPRTDGEVVVAFHPEQVSLFVTPPADIENVFRGIVTSRNNMGSYIDYRLTVGNEEIRVSAPRDVVLQIGQEAFLAVRAAACHCLRG